MGSLDDNDLEFEDESLVSPVGASRKSRALETGPGGPLADFSKAWTVKQVGNRLLNSIRIVIFQSKLNILLLSGPVAVLVHGLTQNSVSMYMYRFPQLFLCCLQLHHLGSIIFFVSLLLLVYCCN